MTRPAGVTDALQVIHNRIALMRTVRTMLKGSGLDIRELANELVISHPGHPEYGRIYITYARGEVTHRRTIWDYLGYLNGGNGEASKHADADPCVNAEVIIGILHGKSETP